MYAYFYCVWLKMLIILQTQELSWAIGSLFVQVVIIHGIYFGLSIIVMLLIKYDIII